MASNERFTALVAANFVCFLLIVGSSSLPIPDEDGANLGDQPAVGNIPPATSGNGNVVPAANGNQMFPPNMPPPPPGALNDSPFPNPPMQGIPVPAGPRTPDVNREDAALPGNPALPGYLPQQPPAVGQMFPPNMPPPPPGAFHDAAPPPPSLAGGMAVPNNVPPSPPVNPNQMFPPNMPPPPPGAVNDPGNTQQYAPPASGSAAIQTPSQVNSELKNTGEPGLVPPKIPTGSMFPPNMPPPPPGAFNDPPPGPVPQSSQFAPASPPADAAAQPVYLTGQQVPNQAIPVAGGQNQFVDPANAAPTTQNQPAPVNVGGADTAIQGMYPGNTAAAAAPSSGSDVVVPNTEERPNPAKTPNPASDGQPLPNDDSQAESDDTGSWDSTQASESDASWETSDSYSADFGASESMPSWLDFGDSESSFLEDSASDDESELGWSDDSSEYSNLDWIFGNSDSEWESEDSSESEWDSELREEEIEEEEEYEEALEEALENENDQEKMKKKVEFVPVVQQGKDGSEGTRLILYCIPAIILAVLVVMAWRNYRGRIRVVTAPIGQESRHYDWKSGSKTDEQRQPMLDESKDAENGY